MTTFLLTALRALFSPLTTFAATPTPREHCENSMASTTTPPSLPEIPEEILLQILSLLLTPSTPRRSTPAPTYPWHTRRPSPSPPPTAAHPHPRPPSPSSVLLVSKTLLRIGTPLLYHTPTLSTPSQASSFANVLAANPTLGVQVRGLVLGGSYGCVADIVKHCPRLDLFDMTIDSPPSPSPSPSPSPPPLPFPIAQRDNTPPTSPVSNTNTTNPSLDELAAFCASLSLINPKHLIIRKSGYLTQPAPTRILTALSSALQSYTRLETTHLTFRCSSTPTSLLLATSLSKLPTLHTLRAAVPVVWNPVILTIASNPSLRRIELTAAEGEGEVGVGMMGGAGACVGAGAGGGGGHWMGEARKHRRLSELISAGTPVSRPRSHTLVPTTSFTTSIPSTSLPAPHPQPQSSRSLDLDHAHAHVRDTSSAGPSTSRKPPTRNITKANSRPRPRTPSAPQPPTAASTAASSSGFLLSA